MWLKPSPSINTIGPLKSLSYVPSAEEPKLNTAPVFLNMDVMSIPSSVCSGVRDRKKETKKEREKERKKEREREREGERERKKDRERAFIAYT